MTMVINGFYSRVVLVRRCLESDFCDCCMDKAYEEG